MSAFVNTLSAPPGGEWFWEDGDVSFSSSSFDVIVDLIRAHLRQVGSTADPVQALVDYMCPRMPRWFCRGFTGPAKPTHADYQANALPYKGYQLETSDVISSRMDRCAKCPMYDRTVCVRCHKIDKWAYLLFGGRRAIISNDSRSGVCRCAKTYAMIVASVVYPETEAVWGGTPLTCWRND